MNIDAKILKKNTSKQNPKSAKSAEGKNNKDQRGNRREIQKNKRKDQ